MDGNSNGENKEKVANVTPERGSRLIRTKIRGRDF